MAGIKDVAAMAGVSVATVSRTVNEPDKVSEQTRRSVQEAIKSLNYHPNVLARDFRKRRTSRVIVLVPDISNTFFASVIRGIQRRAKEFGYSVLLGETQSDPSIEQEYAAMVLSRQADGIIQLSPRNPFLHTSSNEASAPGYWVNACECIEDTTTPKIQIDNAAAMKSIANQVIKMGHYNLCAILGPPKSPLTIARLEGLKAAIKESSDKKITLLELAGDFSAKSGTLAAIHLLENDVKPTAVMCFNDEMAFGLIHQLKQSGFSIPNDISVTGFDDIELAQFCDPPLTTIRQPALQMGYAAMTALNNQIKGNQDKHLKHVLPTELVIRNSISSR